MGIEEIKKVAEILLEYVPATLKLFGATLLFSIPLGMIVALLRKCKIKPIEWIVSFYI